MNRSTRTNVLGMTLIGLISAILILSILVCLMLPVVSEVRAAARSTSCSSNLKQLGVALEMYRALWGCFPAHEWRLGNGDRVRWFQQLDSVSTLGQDVMRCPAEPKWVCGRNNSYGYNYRYLGSARRLADGSLERFPIRMVERSAHTIAFGDASGTGTSEPYEPVPYAQAESTLAYSERKTRIGNQGHLLDPTHIPRRVAQLHGDDLYADGQSPGFVAPRHKGKANFCMADGHVESLEPVDVYAHNGWWNGHGREHARDDHVADKIPGLDERYGW